MTKDEILALADTTFRIVLENPNDSNARVIAAKRENDGGPFLEESIICQADNIEDRVEDAMRAFQQLPPAGLDRFRR